MGWSDVTKSNIHRQGQKVKGRRSHDVVAQKHQMYAVYVIQ